MYSPQIVGLILIEFQPGSLVASGAGGLGWGGGAALGVKLGKPGSFICAM